MLTKELWNAIDPDATGIVATSVAILRDHYAGTSKQRISSMLTVLTTKSKGHDELLTDYIIRAEKAENFLPTYLSKPLIRCIRPSSDHNWTIVM